MKTFITGGTGFIGRHLINRMAKTEHEMVCLVRKTSDVSHLKERGISLAIGDVTDKGSVLEGMRGCDAVLNLANVYDFWRPDRTVYQKVNVEGTRSVMECALELGVAKVVHVSTALIYGNPAEVPFTETSPVGPVRFSEYAETKYQGDLIAWELYETKGLPLVAIYPSGVLGPGDVKASGQYVQALVTRHMPATVFLDAALTWTYVGDVAEVIVRALEKEGNLGERYLVGNQDLTFAEFNRLIHEISGVPLPLIHMPDALASLSATLLTGLANVIKRPPPWGMSVDQIRTMKEGFRFDGSKVERELGLEYTPLRLAIEETIAFYRGEGG